VFLLIYSVLLLAFTLMIWFVLYKIPDLHGLISKRKERLTVNPTESMLIVQGYDPKKENQRHASQALAEFMVMTKENDASMNPERNLDLRNSL